MTQSHRNLRKDAKDMQIHDQSRKIQNLEEACQDLEGTIVQFRELVLSLQTWVAIVAIYIPELTSLPTASSILFAPRLRQSSTSPQPQPRRRRR